MGTRVLDQLHEALDALAGLDPDTLDDATVHDLVVGLAAETTRLEAVWCQLIGVWDNRTLWADNGSKAPGARLARDTHLRRGRADRLVTRSRTLDSMPATAQAYAAGEINGDHVDLIASCDREWRHAIFADHEATLVNICRTPYFHVAAQAVAYWKHRADLDAADDHGDTIKHRRHLSVSPGWDGEIVVNGTLDPVGGEIFNNERPGSVNNSDSSISITGSSAQSSNAALTPSSKWRSVQRPHPPTGYDHARCSP